MRKKDMTDLIRGRAGAAHTWSGRGTIEKGKRKEYSVVMLPSYVRVSGDSDNRG